MEENFKLEIISPEKVIFSGDAKMVVLPSYEGDMSILKNTATKIQRIVTQNISLKENKQIH